MSSKAICCSDLKWSCKPLPQIRLNFSSSDLNEMFGLEIFITYV